jgi:hypothetical protein
LLLALLQRDEASAVASVAAATGAPEAGD